MRGVYVATGPRDRNRRPRPTPPSPRNGASRSRSSPPTARRWCSRTTTRSASCTPATAGSQLGVIDASHRAVARDRDRGGARVPRPVHPCAARTSSAPTTWPGWSRSSATSVEGRTRAGRPALDIPAAIRGGARTRRRRRLRGLRHLHLRVRRILLVPTRRRHGPPGHDRGPAVTAVEVAARLAEVRERIEAAARAAGARPSRDARRRDEGGRPRRGAGRDRRAARSTSARTAPRSSSRRRRSSTAPALRWHFIGRLQRNKVRAAAPFVALWQSVDRAELAAEVGRRAPGASVLVQVNVAGEAQKGGCAPGDARATGGHLRGTRVPGAGIDDGPAGPG